ncbi:WbqC family protein [Abyssalbus ytuae]|uniref:WbqC family protein n=1 Tax=Abyssalbus ytuae TaxID=2926907 RepID=A0A9E7D2P6_9FLAO|nr:WbqC family protein [Abyssalbus ytuae]UOB16914.1 WbqC family protein [Abyssalbus ytuae]
MKSVIHPTYFPSIAHFVVMANHDVIFEAEDNYQKQTYRNRAYIYGPNGKQLLSVPMKHTKKDGRQKYKEVQIENDFNWQKQHWKTLETAYRTSPFFEFYEDEIRPLFKKKHTYLIDLNFETIQLVCDCLQLDINFNKTTTYLPDYKDYKDYRHLAVAKTAGSPVLEPYTQVFEEKNGFINNLSILDLLFNEGTNALTYLENQKNKL